MIHPVSKLFQGDRHRCPKPNVACVGNEYGSMRDANSSTELVPGTLLGTNDGCGGEMGELESVWENVGEWGDTGGDPRGDTRCWYEDAEEEGGCPRQGYFWKPISSMAGTWRDGSATRSTW